MSFCNFKNRRGSPRQPGHVLKEVSNQIGQFLFGILSSNDVSKQTPMLTANNPDDKNMHF